MTTIFDHLAEPELVRFGFRPRKSHLLTFTLVNDREVRIPTFQHRSNDQHVLVSRNSHLSGHILSDRFMKENYTQGRRLYSSWSF